MESVTVYGADWCGDCVRAKQWLDRNQVAYVWVDLEEDPEEMSTVIRYNGGRRNIPVVVFSDGSHLTEPTDVDLAAKRSELREQHSG